MYAIVSSQAYNAFLRRFTPCLTQQRKSPRRLKLNSWLINFFWNAAASPAMTCPIGSKPKSNLKPGAKSKLLLRNALIPLPLHSQECCRRLTRLVKIVRRGFRPRDGQRLDALHLHGNHVVLMLQLPFDQQKLLMHDRNVVLFKYT